MLAKYFPFFKCRAKGFIVHVSLYIIPPLSHKDGLVRRRDKSWKLDSAYGSPSKRLSRRGTQICTIPLVEVFCLWGIFTSKVMVGHASKALANLFIINNLLTCYLSRQTRQRSLHACLCSLQLCCLRVIKPSFTSNYLLNSKFGYILKDVIGWLSLTAIVQPKIKEPQVGSLRSSNNNICTKPRLTRNVNSLTET